MLRQLTSRILTKPTTSFFSAASTRRPFSTEVADTSSGDEAFVEQWKKVVPNIDPPKTPSQYMKTRPPTPNVLPTKLTVNFVLPYASELSQKEVDMVIVPATTGQMGILPGHVPTIAELKPDILAVEAVPLDRLDPAQVQKGLSEFTQKLSSASTDAEKAEAQIGVDVHSALNFALTEVEAPSTDLDAYPAFGVYYYYMSGRYEGNWTDGMYDGYGVETWVKGSRYRGQYRQGLRHGLGVYRFYTGDVYAGEWSSGRSHGCGVHSCEDGSRYAGEFKWGVKHGHGYYRFRNGDAYAGEYFADKMHGFGVYSFANGHKYEGSWHEGKRQGFGVYTFRNGDTRSGHWQNGVLDISPPVPEYRSKVLNAIQEARGAAEKAYDATAKMDEKVNIVVISANRAANAARVAAIKAVQRQMHQRRNSDELPTPVVQNIHHLPTQLTV
nr:putative MORN motif protein [Tanacetum cinerariifolium]